MSKSTEKSVLTKAESISPTEEPQNSVHESDCVLASRMQCNKMEYSSLNMLAAKKSGRFYTSYMVDERHKCKEAFTDPMSL